MKTISDYINSESSLNDTSIITRSIDGLICESKERATDKEGTEKG